MKSKQRKNSVKLEKAFPKQLEFPNYLNSHARPHKLRRYIADEKILSKIDKVSVIPFLMVGKPKNIPKRKLNWPQAQRRNPSMNPYGDADRDGVNNMLDCRPFNKRKQGFGHDDEMVIDFKDIEKLKTVGDVKKLGESLRRRDNEE